MNVGVRRSERDDADTSDDTTDDAYEPTGPTAIVPNPSTPAGADDTSTHGQARGPFAELLSNDNGVTGVAGAILPTNGTVAVIRRPRPSFTPNAVGTSDFITMLSINRSLSGGRDPECPEAQTPPTTPPTTPSGPPVALDDTAMTTQDTAVVLNFSDLLSNDTNATGIDGAFAATNGSVSVDQTAQTVTFTPDAGFTGSADFIYNATNGTDLDGARVTIEVAAMQVI